MKSASASEKGQAIDLTNVLAGYEDQWVIITTDNKHIVAKGDTYAQVKKHIGEGIAMKVPRPDCTTSPSTPR